MGLVTIIELVICGGLGVIAVLALWAVDDSRWWQCLAFGVAIFVVFSYLMVFHDPVIDSGPCIEYTPQGSGLC